VQAQSKPSLNLQVHLQKSMRAMRTFERPMHGAQHTALCGSCSHSGCESIVRTHACTHTYTDTHQDAPKVVQVVHAAIGLHDAVGVGLEGGALLRHLQSTGVGWGTRRVQCGLCQSHAGAGNNIWAAQCKGGPAR